MPLISSFSAGSSRALGLGSGIRPGAPTITSISNAINGTTGTTVDVYFTAGSEGTSPTTTYQYSIDNGSTWSNRLVGTTASPLNITGLTNGITYNVKLRAINSIGSSDGSSSASARPVAIPVAPTISNVSSGNQQLTVSFSAPQGTDANASYEYSLNGSTWSSAGTSSPYSITGLTNDTTYTVYVRTVTTAGDRSSSSSGSSQTPRPPTPATPTLSFYSQSASERSYARLSWNSVTYAYYYDIYANGSLYTTVGSGTTAYDVPVGENTSYNFFVRARNTGGTSGTSNYKYMTTGIAEASRTWYGTSSETVIINTSTAPAGCDPVRFSYQFSGVSDTPGTAGYIRVDSMSARFVSGRKPAAGTPDYSVGQTFDRNALSNSSNVRYYYPKSGGNVFGVIQEDAVPGGNFGASYSTRIIYISTGGSILNSYRFYIGAVAGKTMNSGCVLSTVADYWLADDLVLTGIECTATTYS
jgi:hypothetical protein